MTTETIETTPDPTEADRLNRVIAEWMGWTDIFEIDAGDSIGVYGRPPNAPPVGCEKIVDEYIHIYDKRIPDFARDDHAAIDAWEHAKKDRSIRAMATEWCSPHQPDREADRDCYYADIEIPRDAGPVYLFNVHAPTQSLAIARALVAWIERERAGEQTPNQTTPSTKE